MPATPTQGDGDKPPVQIVCNDCGDAILSTAYEILLQSASSALIPPQHGVDMNLLVCPPLPPPNPVPGWQVRLCSECGCEVAVSPSSLWLL